MDNPGQFLIHLSNRGPSVISKKDGEISNFKLHTRTPIKDINKFGLLHYSIPRQIDTISAINNKFTLNLLFGTTSNFDTVSVTVELPLLDYYSMRISDTRSDAGSVRIDSQLAFDEVLQVSINAAMQKTYAKYRAETNKWGQVLLNRIGCVVNRDKKTGKLNLTFGFRGHNYLKNPTNIATRTYADGVVTSSGNPTEPFYCIDYFGRPVDDTRTINAPVTSYDPITDERYPQRVGANHPLHYEITGVTETGGATDYPETANLLGVQLVIPNERLKFVLGTRGDMQMKQVGEIQRGRVKLVSYGTTKLNIRNTSIVKYECESRPNLDPPSFMYLNVLVAGTRSKVLGQADERAGWALPTSQEGYMSLYSNFPADKQYHVDNVRYIPYIDSLAKYNTFFKANGALSQGGAKQKGKLGNAFDPIPHINDTNNTSEIKRKITKMFNGLSPIEGSEPEYYLIDNFAVIQNKNYTNSNEAFIYNKSRLLSIGLIDENGNLIAPNLRNIRSDKTYVGKYQRGTRAGPGRSSSVFTTSLIEPNYIYTQTENITMQTIDLQLLFGDTSEIVNAESPQPVQLSLIASP